MMDFFEVTPSILSATCTSFFILQRNCFFVIIVGILLASCKYVAIAIKLDCKLRFATVWAHDCPNCKYYIKSVENVFQEYAK